MQTAIKNNWFYNCAPNMVWDFLTRPELLSQWLMENDIKPVVGHKFMFRTKAYPAMEFDGNIYCEILEVVPFKKLSYSWKGGPGDGRVNLDTIVSWTLTPKDKGTELFLEHTGFGVMTNANIYQAMNEGWKKNMAEKLANLISKQHVDETAGH
jgi:uncharacterized protein YndB with AHSA1/START domain